MNIDRTEIILTSMLPGKNTPWEGKLMVVRNGSTLYVPVVLRSKGQVLPLHRRLLKDAGLEHIKPYSPENMGGCYIKVFTGTVRLSGESGDFGPIRGQGGILRNITAALQEFFFRERIHIREIETDKLDVYKE